MVRCKKGTAVCTALLAVSVLVGVAPGARSAGGLEVYRAYDTKTFYYFGEERFESFSCAIGVDMLDRTIAMVRSQFVTAKAPFDVTHSLSAFKLTFVRAGDSLTFSLPGIEITQRKGSKVADPAAVAAGLEQVRSGFNTSVAGVVQMLEALFDEYQLSRFTTMKDVEFHAEEKGYSVKYLSKGGMTVQARWDGKSLRSAIRGQGMSMSGLSTYAPLQDKGLALQSIAISVSPAITMEMTVQYGEVKGLLLPTRVGVVRTHKVGEETLQESYTISLTKCQVRP